MVVAMIIEDNVNDKAVKGVSYLIPSIIKHNNGPPIIIYQKRPLTASLVVK
jgi:hypothetical protein